MISTRPTEKERNLYRPRNSFSKDPLDEIGIARTYDRQREDAERKRCDGAIIGQSESIQWLKRFINKVAPIKSTVLITGESGTGKELVADAIQMQSQRAAFPYVKVNCAAVPENLFESELFGHEKGAFTGAHTHRRGKFELSTKGTILLDEIGELPLNIQAKLLRIVEQKKVDKLGSAKPVDVDVRVLASTNRNLSVLVRQGKFRQDLYHRLNVVFIHVPPLRERLDDLTLLTAFFLEKMSFDAGLRASGVSERGYEILYSYHWPGNVRELANVLERATITKKGEVIRSSDIHSALEAGVHPLRLDAAPMIKQCLPELGGKPLRKLVMDVEKALIIKALVRTGGVQSEAAKLLGVGKKNLWKKINKHSIQARSFRGLNKREANLKISEMNRATA